MRWPIPLIICVLCAGKVESEVAVSIERVLCASLGSEVDIAVTLENPSPDFEMGGFDLLLRYDSTLYLQTVEIGQLLVDCQWEYFTYTSGEGYIVRIVSLSNINNGSHHPTCYGDSPGALANAIFLITNDPSSEGDFLSIKWIWHDCGDNTISSLSGDTLFVSDDVYDFDGDSQYVITGDAPFPTLSGAPSECLGGNGVVRTIDFYNGGIYVTGIDTESPTANCPFDITVDNDPDQCGAVVTFNATVSDNCPGATINCSPASGTFFSIGTTPVTCIAIDAAGNADTCLFNITVYDTTRPVVNCPIDTTVDNNPGQCGATVSFYPTATDNCPGVAVTASPPSGTTFGISTTQVEVIANDASGNTDTCHFNITANDNERPVVFCPNDITIDNDPGQCSAVVTFNPTATDNCHWVTVAAIPPSGSTFNIGSTQVEVVAIDGRGNADTCNFNVIVNDTENPVISCPTDITVDNDSGECGALVTFSLSATDNCSGVTVIANPLSGSMFGIGATQVEVIATDTAGNTDTCTFNVTVNDTEAPIASCPSDITVGNDPDLCGAMVYYDISATDNCPGVTIIAAPPSGTFFSIGATPVQVVATDTARNTDTCQFIVTVNDTSKPAIDCPADIAVQNDPGEYGAVVSFDVSATDNCPDVDVSVNPPSGILFPVGTTVVEITACDATENVDTCNFNIIVALNDPDGDGLPNWDDNCPEDYNPDQADTDSNGVGDACCCVNRGNVDDIIGTGGPIDVADLTYMVDYLFQGGNSPPCPKQGNADGIIGAGVLIDVADLTYLVKYLFQGGPEPPPC